MSGQQTNRHARLRPEQVRAIVAGHEADPFAVLGVHPAGNGGFVARVFLPGAETVAAFTLAGEPLGTLSCIDPAGLFAGSVAISARQPLQYEAARNDARWRVTDPYGFGPVLGPMDDYYLAEGSHLRLFDKLGAHVIAHEGAVGTHFAVWAPHARRVSVVGDFNDWDGRRHVMRLRRDTGVWEIFLPGADHGQRYKYEIVGADGLLQPLKADPYAFGAELRPETASVITPEPAHIWGDDAHRAFWSTADIRRQPISIYEVHAASWRMHDDGGIFHWDELAERLIPYVVEMGFTHIELLPITEYPYDPSWGYQPTGMFAPSARFGDPDGFARFVDGAHRAGIGVILDWVPAHFPVDAHGLARFDGTALYEHEDTRRGFHPDWNTAIYNYGRREVAAFLHNSALFWVEKYHIDGLRVDAVSSMLYRDYSRPAGQWVPNEAGGRENWEAVGFLQEMNRRIYGLHPGVMTIAEESTAWPGVSQPAHENGLGFGFKWNMGFMHDLLAYLRREPIHRRHHHDDITFGLTYAFSENYVLPLSHDEVVHGKRSLLEKMPGDDWRKFATLRACFGFMWGYPGKKLLFMGQEFAQRREWSEARSLDWFLLDPATSDAAMHDGVRLLVRDLNAIYRREPALFARDCEGEGFQWLVVDDASGSSFAWVRRAPDAADIVVISHFTPVVREGYRLRLPIPGWWTEILNSDSAIYGGSGVGNAGVVVTDDTGGALITLPPLATLMLRYTGTKGEAP